MAIRLGQLVDPDTGKPMARKMNIDGNPEVAEHEMESIVKQEEKQRILKVERQIKLGKLKPELVAKWRQDHPEPTEPISMIDTAVDRPKPMSAVERHLALTRDARENQARLVDEKQRREAATATATATDKKETEAERVAREAAAKKK